MQPSQVLPFIVDANVLIDYCESDLSVLSMLSEKVAPVYIGRSTFNKVKQLTVAETRKCHLTIETPDLQTALEASQERGPLAYDDRETLLLAKKRGWICITNDKRLRRECELDGVRVLWGLEPLRLLIESRFIRARKAITVALKIKSANPKFVTEEIIERFKKQIEQIEKDLQSHK